ncbi:unnamed protein product [Macrosiphum euphorbiae]|uniref:Uncharacterized protein n=1 Tax=Macrosiphum euphorbiae TaxID=13131 RepID=A0AAV0XF08_9HEMI|nr:unnamed protein product [Macrosiphum euphorbiae]
MKRRSLSLLTRSVLLSRSQQKLDFLITIFLLLCSKIFISGPFSTLSALALEFALTDETFIEFKKIELSVKSSSSKSSPIFISEEISLKLNKCHQVFLLDFWFHTFQSPHLFLHRLNPDLHLIILKTGAGQLNHQIWTCLSLMLLL